MKTIFTSLILLCSFFAQSQTSTFKSDKYGYTINKPSGFESKPASGKRIDYKVVSSDGSSITVLVSKRLPEEKAMDGHSYTREYFKQIFELSNSNNTIEKTEKILITGTKAFLIFYSYPYSTKIRLNVIEAHFFAGDNAFLITTTSDDQHYDEYKSVFLNAIKSFRLAKN